MKTTIGQLLDILEKYEGIVFVDINITSTISIYLTTEYVTVEESLVSEYCDYDWVDENKISGIFTENDINYLSLVTFIIGNL